MNQHLPEELALELVRVGLGQARDDKGPIVFVSGTVNQIASTLDTVRAPLIVAVITSDTDDNAERLIAAGATDVVWWPADRERIQIRISMWRRMAELETARVRAEDRVRFLYDKVPAMCHSIDADGRLISVSDAWLATLGYTREEVIGKRSSDFLVSSSRRLAVERVIPDFLRTGRTDDVEYQFRAKDGSVVDVRLSAIAERDLDGNLTRSVAISANVTALRKLTERLVDADALLSNILNNVPDPLFVKDEQHRWIALNQSFCDFMGRRAEELLGHSDFDFFPREEAEVFWRKDEAVFASGLTNENEESLTDAQGERHVIATKKAMFTDAHGHKVLVGIIRDLTERKRLESQLSLTERMASVGTLAAGVAHELNNPLAYVVGNIEFVLTSLAAGPTTVGDDVLESLADAAQGATRIRDIVRDMKTFSQVEPEHLGRVEVQAAVQLAVRMVSNQLRHVARVVHEIPDNVAVLADQSRLGQVMVNLLVNAIQAFASQDPRNEVRIDVSQVGEEITIAVRDNGSGIAPEVLGRIFDPFFTTKPVGVGTGLGLSICHGIVTALGGRITIDSQLGIGTTVRVILRAWQAAPERTTYEMPKVAGPGCERARILIVEDDLMVAKSFKRNLSGEYDVTIHQDANIALAEIAGGVQFDLILCDVMMPVTNGIVVYEKLATIDPTLLSKFAFVTGGTFTEEARRFLDETPTPRLYKPTNPTELRAFVRQILERNSNSQSDVTSA